MNNQHLSRNKGFTLVEILLALFVGLILLATIYFSVVSGQRSSVAIESKVVAQQDVRAILDVMALEIGMASYNPTHSLTLWDQWRGIRDVPNPAPPPANFAMDRAIRVLMDLDGTRTLSAITYIYDVDNQQITRDNGLGPEPFLGDAAGSPRSVRVVNNDAALPVFRYFDPAGVEIPLANLPARIPEIRRIEITLAVETEEIDPSTRQRRRMIYTTSVIPRNHGLF
jgi:prepilin-type N-terminal cleavage/methylation domain-containing protein